MTRKVDWNQMMKHLICHIRESGSYPVFNREVNRIYEEVFFRFRVRGKVKAQVQVRFEILLWLYLG